MTECGIETEFLGRPLPPCARPGDIRVEGRCNNGHERTRFVCELHAAGFTALPQSVYCAQCHSEGVDAVVTFTIGEPADRYNGEG